VILPSLVPLLMGIDNLCNHKLSVLFRLGYMTRLFPICTDIVKPPILMLMFIMVALIDRFTTERASSLRLLGHLLHTSSLFYPFNPRCSLAPPLYPS
jgi:hypothetical protein